MFRKFISVDAEGVVRDVVEAVIANGFYIAPRDDIRPGDVLTTDEKIMIGMESAPEGYVAPEPPPIPPMPVIGEVLVGEDVQETQAP